MGHCHTLDRTRSISALKKTLVLVLVFMVIEVIFGWIAHSLALVSDALHLFTDAGSLSLSLFAFWLAKRPPNKRLTFGYHRVEILAAAISGGSTLALAIFLIIKAISRFVHPHPVHGLLVLIVASVGLLANIVMMKLLHSSSKESLNVKGAYLHVLGDLLASIGVVFSGLIITLTNWYPIDPIMTIVLSLLILWSALKLIRETVNILMEAAPRTMDLAQIEKDILLCPSVIEVHDLHVWSLTEGRLNLSAHIRSKEPTKALEETTQMLYEKHHIHHTTIQVEPESGPCISDAHEKSR